MKISNPHHQQPGLKILRLLVFIFFIPYGLIEAQVITETIEKTAHFQTPAYAGNSLKVYNIQGDVSIEGYDGDEILITAQKRVEARNERDAERGHEELQLVIEEEADLVLIYVDAPFVEMRRRNGSISYNMNRKKNDYDFLIGITIRVPEKTNIHGSTVNNGKVVVKNISAENLAVSNVNGDVLLEMVSGKTRATTVNGRIQASYSRSPDQDSEYTTVNGTIEVEYPADLSADIRFRSVHGDLYTDFENIERLKAVVESGSRNHRAGTNWRIDKFSPIRIGNGGPEFQFRVVNGDVYLKQIQS